MAEKKVFRIGHLPITDHLILGVAKDMEEKGKLADAEFGLELVPMMGWNEIGDAIHKKAVDGVFILAPYAMDLFKSGEKIQLVLFGHKNGSILIMNNSANISSIEGFKGKLVIFPYLLSIHVMLFHRLLKAKGLELGPGKDVAYEVMAPSQIPEAIEWDEEGEIAGYIVAEPFGSQVVKKGLGTELAMSKDIWPSHPCCVCVMRDEVLNEHDGQVQQLVSTLVEAGRFAEEQPKETAQIGSAFLKQDVDVVERVLTDPPDRVTTGELFPVVEDLVRIKEYMDKEMGKLQGDLDFGKFVNTKYAEAAGAK